MAEYLRAENERLQEQNVALNEKNNELMEMLKQLCEKVGNLKQLGSNEKLIIELLAEGEIVESMLLEDSYTALMNNHPRSNGKSDNILRQGHAKTEERKEIPALNGNLDSAKEKFEANGQLERVSSDLREQLLTFKALQDKLNTTTARLQQVANDLCAIDMATKKQQDAVNLAKKENNPQLHQNERTLEKLGFDVLETVKNGLSEPQLEINASDSNYCMELQIEDAFEDTDGPGKNKIHRNGYTTTQQYTVQPQLQVSSKPEQRYLVSPSPTPQQFQSSTAQYHQLALPHPSPTAHQPSVSHHPHHHQQQQQQQQQQRHVLTSNDAVTPRDGFTPLNAGSFISIQTTAPPFSQQILKHNSLHPQNPHDESRHGVVTYSSTGPPPTPQQVIFSSPPTNNNNLGPFVSSTAAPRHFDHGPTQQPSQQNFHYSTTYQPQLVSSTASPFIDNRGSVTQQISLSTPTPYSTPNNFVAAPTQSPFYTTSPGHRQNPYLPHNHGKQKTKQQQRPASLSAASPSTFPQGGITTTIKYPEGTGKLRLDFSGGNTNNRRNIVDFTYNASPTSTPNTFVSSSTTPYPSSGDRFTQSVSSTTITPQTHSFQSPSHSSERGPGGGRYAGAVKNKSNLSSSAIYVDTAATAESVSTPVTVPSPSATTPSSVSPLPPVSTSNYGLRLLATAKKRMTGAWQSYFSSKIYRVDVDDHEQ